MSDFHHHFYQARLHRAKFEFDEAEKHCAKALEIEPRHVGALSLFGRINAIKGYHEKAKDIFARATQIEPKNPALLIDLANVLRGMGDFDGARATLEKAIRIDKNFAPAFYTLSAIHRFEPGDPLIDDFIRLKKKAYGNPAWRCIACFALGKVYDDIGEWDLAFENYAEGNQRRPAQYNYAHKQKLHEALKNCFTPELMKSREQFGNLSKKPVFIVGMLRSGSSLIEELLSRSDEIAGLGEPQHIEDLFTAAYQHTPQADNKFSLQPLIDNSKLSDFGDAYLERVQEIAPDAKRLIDKNLFNYTLLGFVRMLFPKASIIHAKRDAIDTCLSCYFQNFTEGHDFSFDLADLGKHYAAYSDLMHHWTTLFGDEIFDAPYENIVADKDTALAALFAQIDLPPPGAAALAAPAGRAIPTASAWQARQPIYATSVKRWKNYEKHLGPLFAALGEAGFDYQAN